ncbi:DUF4123 domain-containing protein [Litchfieldella rifensis]|uniref:DUF4123 domain-containing protein n=1 Tax=Litchfieldella rifensis TaxID=762643 RepID=A0ABV7LP73_9GAMM
MSMIERWPLTQGLLGGDWIWPIEHQVYLMLDGVRVPELPRKLYEWSDGRLNADLLYAGTPWAEVKDVSPWLVQLAGHDDPVLQHFLEEGLEGEWGYLMACQADLGETADHLKSLIQVRHPANVPMLLRLADPAVITALLTEGSSSSQLPWGPIEQLIVPDAVSGEWRSWSPESSTALPPKIDPTGYQLTETQVQRLKTCDLRRDIRHLMGFVDEYCPGWLLISSDAERYARLAEIVHQGREMGFSSLREWGLLCTLMARLQVTSLDMALLPDGVHTPLLDTSQNSGLARLKAALAAVPTGQPNATT